jgi:hypothetical protein
MALPGRGAPGTPGLKKRKKKKIKPGKLNDIKRKTRICSNTNFL